MNILEDCEMACLPETGRCERERTDAFVRHLNRVELCSFEHALCLDQIYRNAPQPEAMYVEQVSGGRLVIERKTIAWPLDYIVRHQNDHLVASVLIERVGPLATDAPYAFVLQPAIQGHPGELAAFGRRIAENAAHHFSRVRSGRAIGSAQPGRQWKLFRENPRNRAIDGEPDTGLVIRWYPEETLDVAKAPPEELLSEIHRHFASCELKFREYLLDRCVLILDPHGELRHLPVVWWHEVLQLRTPSRAISEVWTGLYDWVSDRDQGWLFKKIYPMVGDDGEV